MKKVIVNVVNYLNKIENLDEYLQKEFAAVTAWKEQGILENLFIKEDQTGAILIFTGIDEAKAKELMPNLPMFGFFSEVTYFEVDKRF